jgi:hypothetical protein
LIEKGAFQFVLIKDNEAAIFNLGEIYSDFWNSNSQSSAYAKFYAAKFNLTFLFFFACPKNEPKKGKKSNASPRKAHAPLAGFLG